MSGDRKADSVVGLFDHRVLAIECEVSHSEPNSVKRVNDDAAVKAKHWTQQFGQRQIVLGVVLSGVFVEGTGPQLRWGNP